MIVKGGERNCPPPTTRSDDDDDDDFLHPNWCQNGGMLTTRHLASE